MKYLKQTICAALTLISGAAFSATDFCSSLEGKVYTQASGMYISDNTFHGGGFAVRAGYNMNELIGWQHVGIHNLELEANFLFERANASSFAGSVLLFGIGQPPYNVTQHRRVDLDMYPIMLNYRYMWQAKELVAQGQAMPWWSSCGIYVGGGVGVNIVHYENNYTLYAVDTTGANPPFASPVVSNSTTKGEFAGQLFGGLSYNFTEKFVLTGGGRLFFTAEQSFGNNLVSPTVILATPGMEASVMHWMIEGAVGYTW